MANSTQTCKSKSCGKRKATEDMVKHGLSYFCDNQCFYDHKNSKPVKPRKVIKAKPVRQNKYTKAAKGQECQIRIPHVCNNDPETVVLAHLDDLQFQAGHKSLDIHGAFSCYACHNAVAGLSGSTHSHTTEELKLMHLQAVIRTQMIFVQMGLINALEVN